MKSEQKKKKGFFGMLKESFNKTGGCCCGPGETCDNSGNKTKETSKEKSTAQPAQK